MVGKHTHTHTQAAQKITEVAPAIAIWGNGTTVTHCFHREQTVGPQATPFHSPPPPHGAGGHRTDKEPQQRTWAGPRHGRAQFMLFLSPAPPTQQTHTEIRSCYLQTHPPSLDAGFIQDHLGVWRSHRWGLSQSMRTNAASSCPWPEEDPLVYMLRD